MTGPKLERLPATATAADVVAVVERDGAAIVADLLDEPLLRRIRGEVDPYLDGSGFGRDDSAGRKTKRVGALIARSPACRGVVVKPLVLGACAALLSRRYHLHLTQLIEVHPGQDAQPLHRDRLVWGRDLPRTIEPQLNTLWALTDFTAANGATRVAPGSHRWPDERRADESEVCQAEMTRGSALIYTGSVIHGAGGNRSDAARLGMNITYSLVWLRQEENQFLSCPPDIARTLPEDLQELLGYTMANYALGYFSSPIPLGDGLPDTLPPELALGRRPRNLVEADPADWSPSPPIRPQRLDGR